MSEQPNAISRTHRFKSEALEFIDAYGATYGLSKSAVVNFAIFNLKKLLDDAAKDDPRKGSRVGMAMAMQAEQTNS